MDAFDIVVCTLIAAVLAALIINIEVSRDKDGPSVEVTGSGMNQQIHVNRGNSVTVISNTTPEEYNLRILFEAICEVESNGNDDAYNQAEDALGAAQIRPIMVDDVNRIQTSHKRKKRYIHEDAKQRSLAFEMFKIYTSHYYPEGSNEQLARAWNGGPNGPRYRGTRGYWDKVSKVLNDSRLLAPTE